LNKIFEVAEGRWLVDGWVDYVIYNSKEFFKKAVAGIHYSFLIFELDFCVARDHTKRYLCLQNLGAAVKFLSLYVRWSIVHEPCVMCSNHG